MMTLVYAIVPAIEENVYGHVIDDMDCSRRFPGVPCVNTTLPLAVYDDPQNDTGLPIGKSASNIEDVGDFLMQVGDTTVSERFTGGESMASTIE